MTGAFVDIPGGSFSMGSRDGQDDEAPVHAVHVDAFAIAACPVTREEYERFIVVTGHPAPRVDAIALDLDQGDGRLGRRAVEVRNAVPGVLPALVPQASFGLALVLDQSIPVLVAVLLDPAQRGLGRGKELLARDPIEIGRASCRERV